MSGFFREVVQSVEEWWTQRKIDNLQESVLIDRGDIQDQKASWLSDVKQLAEYYEASVVIGSIYQKQVDRLKRLFLTASSAVQDDEDTFWNVVDKIKDTVTRLKEREEDSNPVMKEMLRSGVKDEDLIRAAKDWDDSLATTHIEEIVPNLSVAQNCTIEDVKDVLEIDSSHTACDAETLTELALHDVPEEHLKTYAEESLLSSLDTETLLRLDTAYDDFVRETLQRYEGDYELTTLLMDEASQNLDISSRYLVDIVEQHPRINEDVFNLSEPLLSYLSNHDGNSNDSLQVDLEAIDRRISDEIILYDLVDIIKLTSLTVKEAKELSFQLDEAILTEFIRFSSQFDLSHASDREAFEQLLEHGRKPFKRNSLVGSALARSIEQVKPAVFRYLSQKGDAFIRAFCEASGQIYKQLKKDEEISFYYHNFRQSAAAIQIELLEYSYEESRFNNFIWDIRNYREPKLQTLMQDLQEKGLNFNHFTKDWADESQQANFLTSLQDILSLDTRTEELKRSLNYLFEHFDLDTCQLLIQLLREDNMLDELSEPNKAEAIHTFLAYVRGTHGIETQTQVVNKFYLWDDYLQQQIRSGSDYSLNGLRKMLKQIQDQGIIGDYKPGDLVYLDENDETLRDVYRVEDVTARGYTVENTYTGSQVEQVQAHRLDRYKEGPEWNRVRNLRKKGFLVIHSCNAYRMAENGFINLRKDLTTELKYSFSCSTIHPNYNCSIAVPNRPYSFGVVLDKGKIYAAWSCNAFTTSSDTDNPYYREAQTPKEPIPTAVKSNMNYNEVLPQNWEVGGVYYTVGDAHSTPSSVRDQIRGILRELYQNNKISGDTRLLEIHHSSNTWETVSTAESLASGG